MPRLSRRVAEPENVTKTSSTSSEEPSYAKPSSGWDAFKSARSEVSSGDGIGKEDWWKPGEDEALVKFVEGEPFAAYFDTWVPAKNRSYSTLAADTPLTKTFDLRPSPRATFNIMVFEPSAEPGSDGVVPGEWVPRVLRAAVTLGDKIAAMHESRHGPIDQHYWEMTASGTKKNYSVNMQVVKESDLLEEWGVNPPSEAELARMEESKRTRQDIFIHSDDDLAKVVKELMA